MRDGLTQEEEEEEEKEEEENGVLKNVFLINVFCFNFLGGGGVVLVMLELSHFTHFRVSIHLPPH